MAMQTTLVILKPDAVQRGLMGEILSRFERKGLEVIGAKLMLIPRELAEEHYAVHKERPFFASLVGFMTSSPVMVLALRGDEAINVVRGLMGKTDGRESAPGTIRGDFGMSKSFNLVHGSDGEDTAATELKLFFKDGELVEMDRAIDRWVNDPSG